MAVSLTREEIADAVRFRTGAGLRADEAWIRAVAADPRSWRGSLRYNTPLTPEEVAELDARQRNAELIVERSEAYGRRFPAEWAGLFIDHKAGGVVAVLFSGHVAEHADSIRGFVGPGARFEVRAARWSLAELDTLSERIRLDEAWLRTVDTWLESVGPHVSANAVRLRVSSSNPEAVSLITEHYHGAGWLIVESDGIGRWTGPRGSLVVRAVTAGGEPVPDLDCVSVPDEGAAWPGGGMGFVTDADGVCRFQGVGATRYTVELRAFDPWQAAWVTVGRERVRVLAASEAVATIVIGDLPQSRSDPPIDRRNR